MTETMDVADYVTPFLISGSVYMWFTGDPVQAIWFAVMAFGLVITQILFELRNWRNTENEHLPERTTERS